MLLGLLYCATAAAQAQPVSYIGDFYVLPGREEEFLNLVKKYDEPVLNQLMAEGAVLAWGVDVPILHLEGAPTHMVWWSVPDMAAFDKVMAAFEAAEKKWAEEYAKLADEARRKRQAAPKPVMEQLLDTVDLNRHRDWLLRTQVSNFTDATPPADAKPYSWITMFRVKPGKAAEFRQLFDRYAKPTYDRLVADGVIIGYELGVEEAKSTDAFTHYVWVVLPNLAAREKTRSAFMALNESRAPEAREAIEHLFLNTVDPAATRTFVQRTIYLKLPAK
jgi:uncharacterized protein (DUF1810 family)